MTKENFANIIETMPQAYAYHELVLDQSGHVVDYVFLNVNSAFETMTGLKKSQIINRKVSEVVPAIKLSDFDWIGLYAKVAKSGESASFEQYSEPLNKWYEVTAFSDRKDYFCTIFKEITQDMVEKTALKEIADLSEYLLHHFDHKLSYERIALAAKHIAGAKAVGLNLYNSEGTAFKTVSLVGVFDSLRSVSRMLGFNPVGKEWPHDTVRENHLKDNEITGFESLKDLTGTVIATKLVESLERLFNAGKVYVAKIKNNDKMLGDFTIIMPDGVDLQNEAYIKVLTGLIGQFMEHKLTQNRLKAKTDELEQFFDVNLDLLCIADTDGNFIRVNKTWGDVLGYSQKELEQRKFLDFIHPDDLAPTLATINILKQQKQVLKFVNRYRAKDGTYKFIEWRSHPSGSMIYAAARDITEQMKVEQDLKNSERKFRLYTEKAPVSIFVADFNGQFKMVNQTTCELTGFSEQELLRRSMLELIAPEFRKTSLEMFKDVKNNELVAGDVRVKSKDGHYFWINIYAIKVSDNELIGFAQDITERKQMLDALQMSHTRFDELARQSRTITWSVDENGYYTDINPVVEKIFGYSPEDLVGNIRFFDIFVDDRYETIKKQFLGIFEKKEPFIDFINTTLAKNGERVVVATNGLPILDENGNLSGYNGSDTDITERVRLEEEKYFEQEKFKATLLSVGDGIIATDDHAKITVMNSVAEYLTEWTEEEARGQPLDKVFKIIHEYTKESCDNPAEQVLLNGQVIELENHTALVTKTGRLIPIEDSAAPIKSKNGIVTGVVIVFRDYTEKREKQREVEYLSFHDHLTGLYNRRYLEDALSRLDTARNLPFAIIVIDVNGLKLTNDAYGHDMGDKLLQAVAGILSKACRSDDIIARTGGDEFIILLPQTSSGQTELIKRRIHTLAHQTKLESIVLSLAIGYEVKTNQDQDVKQIMRQADNLMYKNKLKYGKLMRSQTIETVLRSINNKYDNEQIHTERVSVYCEAIARAMGFDEHEIQDIKTVSVLHDIGKITVSPEILNKKEKLTADEWHIIKQHPVTGYNILKGVEEYATLAEIVLYHHERWDGNGYPSGVKGKNIPLYSRIITVADAYEAMTASRSYQRTKSNEEAIDELRKCAGTQFDPDIVKVFVKQVLGS